MKMFLFGNIQIWKIFRFFLNSVELFLTTNIFSNSVEYFLNSSELCFSNMWTLFQNPMRTFFLVHMNTSLNRKHSLVPVDKYSYIFSSFSEHILAPMDFFKPVSRVFLVSNPKTPFEEELFFFWNPLNTLWTCHRGVFFSSSGDSWTFF